MDASTLSAPLNVLNPKEPICVEVGTLMDDVIDTMKKNRIGCICVTENKNLAGIITERDVLTKVLGGNLDAGKITVNEIMTHDPEYLYEDDLIAFAVNRMHVGGFRHIPLINLDGNPTGVISVRDILGHLTRSLGSKN